MAKNPKILMEREAGNLIEAITGFDRDEQNFELCEKFALSNLFYHKYLDPDDFKIQRELDGVVRKFKIHAQPDKAEALDHLVDKYKAGAVFEDRHDQYDIKFRLLSLLLNLAEAPVAVPYNPEDSTPDEEEDEQIDWWALLKDGEKSPESLGSISDLSEWSDSETEKEINEEVFLDDEGIATVVVTGLDKQEEVVAAAVDSEIWIRNQIQFPFWKDEQVVKPKSDALTANLAAVHEKFLEDSGKLDARTEKVTEYQLLREILWMLRHPVDSPIFELRDGEFFVTERVTIPSLTSGTMTRLLADLTRTFRDLWVMKRFISRLEGVDLPANVPNTVEAYASGLNNFLHAFSSELVRVEGTVHQQEETVTLVSVLDRLSPWFTKIRTMFLIHRTAVSGFDDNPNWYKSVKLLSVLYNALFQIVLPDFLPFLMELFLKSVQPYFNIIQTWLTEGRLEDWQGEFIFYKKDANDEDEQFWNEMFKSHGYEEKLKSENIEPFKLLDGLAQKIFVSGKSIEILSKLDQIFCGKNNTKFDEENNNKVLFEDFVENIRQQLPKKELTQQIVATQSKIPDELQEIVDSANDPYLALAFAESFRGLNLNNDIPPTSSSPPPSPIQDLHRTCLLQDRVLDPLRPLGPVLHRSLAPTIHSHYTRACLSLVRLFTEDLEIDQHLSCARRVFFMEAGDLLHEFCSQLFHLLEQGDQDLADSASLTILLQDCLARRYPGWADQFSCSYLPPPSSTPLAALDGLQIHYSIHWPLNIVLTSSHLSTYNKVFVFLAQVKRSLWSLQSVRLSRLQEMEDGMDITDTDISFNNTSISHIGKRHRLQLLRAWLLYFVTVVHGYFMSRVVHSTELELKSQLAAATDLDMIIQVHQAYINRIYDRCFLHPSASMLREAVCMVLGVGLELHQATISSLPIHTRTIATWEEKYSRCHQFLATTLQSMTTRMRLPHLEGLAAALLHSCPQ